MIVRDDAPLGSPGCFGRALSFRAGTPECDTCPFTAVCAPLSLARTEAIRIKMGIATKPIVPIAVKVERQMPAAAMGLSLPTKVIELLGRIERAGTRVTETLARGENPFTETPAFMRIVCHVLLAKPQGVSRRYLTACLMHKFGWKETTATPHATMALQALCALGAARESDGLVSLTR